MTDFISSGRDAQSSGLDSERVAGGIGLSGLSLTREVFLRKAVAGAVGLSGLAAVLAACGGDTSTTGATAGGGDAPVAPQAPTGSLRAPLTADIVSLDPANTTSEADYVVIWATTDVLVDAVVPERSLAASHSVSDDGLTWTFKLRPDVAFHDGAKLDADAVLKNFAYWQTSRGVRAALIPAKFTKAQASDPLTVVVSTAAPFADFARNLTNVRILSPRQLARGRDVVAKAPIGTGPFRFVSSKPGTGVRLEAFEDYWGKGPYLTRLELPIVAQESARITGLQSGQLDVAQRLPPPQVKSIGSTPSVKLDTVDSNLMSLLGFRFDVAPTDDPKVRQAIAHAIDRDALLKGVYFNQGKIVDNLQPSTTYGYTDVTATYPYDPDKARALLKDAGHADGVDVNFVGALNVHIQGEQMRQAIVGQLKDVGIRAKLQELDSAAFGPHIFSAKYKANMWLSDYGWAASGAPDIWTLKFIALVTGFTGVDKLIDKAVALPDGPEREAALADIQNTVAEQVAFWPLAQHKLTTGLNKDVYGFTTPSDGFNADFRGTYKAAA